jgi:hypothetical protein
LSSASWPEINDFRAQVSARVEKDLWLTDASRHFASLFVERFPSVVLARVFAVVPFERLPAVDAEVARAFAEKLGAAQLLVPNTPVLSLLGTSGIVAAWNQRASSAGHLAIPLLSRELVEGAPMIAQLLADLKVDLACLDDARPIDSKKMLGGTNQRFYVPSAKTAVDARGRFVIPSRDFVERHRIETVFGMAGAYVDGMIIAAILFTTENLDVGTVDRFPSIIGNFRMATTTAVLARRIYGPGTAT